MIFSKEEDKLFMFLKALHFQHAQEPLPVLAMIVMIELQNQSLNQLPHQ